MNNTFKDKILNVKNMFLNELFPEKYSCFNCGEELCKESDFYLCDNCLKNILLIKNPCKKCGVELNSFTNYCHNCKDKERHFDLAVCSSKYENVAKNLVYKFKYNGEKYISKIIYKFMLETIKSTKFLKQIDLIIPVPLSQQRLKERGFNQAEILSNLLATELKIEHSPDVIKRTKSTQTQTHLNKLERKENLKNAFEVVDKLKLKNKTVLVVDDIITTGATLDEISSCLKKAGVKKVYGLAFCHAGDW